MFQENDIEKICKIIEEEFECVTGVDVAACELFYGDLIEIPYIHADDRLGTTALDNNTHALKKKLKRAGYEVFDPEFNRKDAYPDGTSLYSIKIELDEI